MSHDERTHKKRRLNIDEADTSAGRPWTISIAVPGSIIDIGRRDDQRTNIVNHLARAAAVFGIDEIVVFDDTPMDKRPRETDPESYMGETDPCRYVEHQLNYLEVPPFMRKVLMPLHPNLRGAGLLPSIDMPSHPNPQDWLPYREGVTTSQTPPGKTGGTVVDIGRKGTVVIKEDIPPNTRITLRMDDHDEASGVPVHPDAPRTVGGLNWGYNVRRCASLAAVFEECPYEDGYDLSVGTSERGTPVRQAISDKKIKDMSQFNHLLVVFGGPRGLEYAAENDPTLQEAGIIRGKTKELFDHWVNILPKQACRAIRTDEAVFIGMTGLARLWEDK